MAQLSPPLLLPIGSPGSAVTHDPDRPGLAAYTLTGGTIGRALTEDASGRWLLDLNLGGFQWRFSDAEVTPNSRDDNRPRVYVTGLSAIDFDIGAESVSVALRGPAASMWARLGPIRQRPFVLRRWFDRMYLEDAPVVLQGVVDAAQWGDPSDPATLTLTLRRALRELSLEMCAPDLTVTEDAWDTIEEGNYGQLYPIIIGHPGSIGNIVPRGDATPGFVVRQPTLPKVLIAGHHVEALQVFVWDEAVSSNVTMDVLNGFDNFGNPVATTDPLGAGGGSVGDPQAEITVGWSRQTGWGGGLSHRGELVDGLGDVLRWVTETRSRAVYDRGEMEARRSALNRFRVAFMLNEAGLKSHDWLARNILEVYELEETHGPRGVYYVERKYVTDATEVRGTLTTDGSVGGYRVQRASAVVEEVDELANEITVEYAPVRMSTSTFRSRVTIGASTVLEPTTAGILAVATAGDIRCGWSKRFFGSISKSWAVGTTWDDATATAVAQQKVSRHALPYQLVSYDGGRDLLDWTGWDTAAIWDQTPGADFQLDLGIVLGLTMLDHDAVRLHLRVPMDPLRRPTLSPP